MDPLAVVEAQISGVDSWPSYVLRYMFLLEPNAHVMKVAAFMYGNDVRLSDAMACYNACNGRRQSRVETVLRAWYFVWDRDVNQSHKEQYYSMRLKCQAWINGKAREQYEVVQPVVTISECGPAGTRYPGRIGLKIESIRSSSSSSSSFD